MLYFDLLCQEKHLTPLNTVRAFAEVSGLTKREFSDSSVLDLTHRMSVSIPIYLLFLGALVIGESGLISC
jgi:hypothetical protein